jgi:hypothetical protein
MTVAAGMERLGFMPPAQGIRYGNDENHVVPGCDDDTGLRERHAYDPARCHVH